MSGGGAGIRVVADAAEVARLAAEAVREAAAAAVAARGVFTLALSGGSTPRALYLRLASPPGLPWARTHVFWGDERHVPPDHPDSNFRMANEAMLAGVPIPAGNIHRVRAEDPDPARAAAEYEAEVRRVVAAEQEAGGRPRFDLVLLGLGPDAHTASLFPGTDAVREVERLVAAPRVEEVGAHRITFTPALLNAARSVLFLVAGADKADAVHAVLRGPTALDRFPAQVVRPAAGAVLWIIDRAAAGRLEAS
jgi:6-phosphogluconolactonase